MSKKLKCNSSNVVAFPNVVTFTTYNLKPISTVASCAIRVSHLARLRHFLQCKNHVSD